MKKIADVQFVNDQEGLPVLAILPYPLYEKLIAMQPQVTELPNPLNVEGRYINLPEAPGEKIDLDRLVEYCLSQSAESMAAGDDSDEILRDYELSLPVNARTQALELFKRQQRGGLDHLIREHFLPEDSPYKNTMQATAAVVDALVKTGLFVKTKRKFDFYRPVNALDFNQAAGLKFREGKPKVDKPIPPYFWLRANGVR